MSVAELLPSLEELSRADKLRIVSYLVTELEKEETNLAAAVYPIWSPYDAHEAAATLMTALTSMQNKESLT